MVNVYSIGHRWWYESRQRLVCLTLFSPPPSTSHRFRYPTARPETTREIFERALALCPELAPPEIRATREPTVDDLYPLIVEEGCGFRPSRKGGISFDTQWVKSPNGEIPVISNYGHGGGGYQSSWGSATVAVERLEGAFASKQV